MATVNRNFEELDTSTIDGGSEAQVTDAGTFSENISLATHEGVHCWVEADFASTTDDLVIEVQASPDDGPDYDSIPLFSFTISAAVGVKSLSFIVTSVFSFRVKFSASGSTDPIGTTFKYSRWNWVTV